MAARIAFLGMSQHIQGLHWDFSGNLSIGRQPSADLVLNHPTVNRQHAEVYVTPRGWMVRDLSQVAGGTLINGLALAQTPRRLQKDDVLQCGKLQLQVAQIEEQAPPAPPLAKGPADIRTTGEFVCVQALSQRSWEEGLHEVRHDDARLARGQQFITLLQGGYYLSRIHCARDFFQTFLDDARAVLNARRAAIVFCDDVSQEFQLRTASLAKKLAPGERCFSSTLARRCFFKGESILCQNMAHAADLQSSKSIMVSGMGSIMCMLLRTARRRLGILHLERGPLQEPFTQDDFVLAEAIVVSISAAMESALTVEKQHTRLTQQGLRLARLLLEKVDPNLVERGQRVSQLAGWLGEELRLEPDEQHELALTGLLLDLAAIPGVATLFSLTQPNDPRLGRILAMARALDEKLHAEPGQTPLAVRQVVAWFQARAGTEFDSECVEVLENVISRAGRLSHEF